MSVPRWHIGTGTFEDSYWTFPKGMSSVKQSIWKLLPTFAHKLIYWPPISWRASWCYNMADTRTVLFALCWDIFCVKLQKHLLLGHAWLENVDCVGLKYMSNFDQPYCYNHFNMSFTRPSVGYARLAEKFVNQSPIYVQWEIFHPVLLMMSFCHWFMTLPAFTHQACLPYVELFVWESPCRFRSTYFGFPTT